MQLYLVRHAPAAPSSAIFDDTARPLTRDGVARMRRSVKGLADFGLRLDEIWTSPLLRARQTADLLMAGIDSSVGVRVVNSLEPAGEFEALVQQLREFDRENIALVGHEPYLGEFATLLITGQRTHALRFKKGGVGCIEVADFQNPIRGEFLWLLTPKQMAMLS